jgi:protein-S-isoprenylcysteine O-methyltransferase Ste14
MQSAGLSFSCARSVEMPPLYPLPATQPLAATLYTLALVICAVPECGRLLTRRHRAGATERDGGSLVLLLALLALSLVSAGIAAWLLPSAAIIHGRVFVFGAGVALILIGMALRAYAIRALGRYFVITVAVEPNQQVVESGPYRLIRHPSYTGALLALLGIALALTNWASLAAIILGNAVGFGYRVMVEERALSCALGQSYSVYMRRTRRLIPFIF